MDLLSAAAAGDLERVQWLLVNGEASITMRNNGGYSALLLAAQGGHIPIISWLLAYGGSSITERNKVGDSAVLCAARSIRLPTVQWLLENGANVTETDYAGRSVWDPLGWRFTPRDGALTANLVVRDAAAVTALLRVMVLQGAPPAELAAELAPEHALVVQEGARLRARLPAFLIKRKELLNEHCLLIAPLRDLVRSYDPEPVTTDEIWATGIGTAP